MNQFTLNDCKQWLADADRRSMNALEQALCNDGFTSRIEPLELEKAHWYLRHVELKGTKDNLLPYVKGFVLEKDSRFVAAYGIKDSSCRYRGKRLYFHQHFFFIDDSPRDSMLEFLVRKAEHAPGQPILRTAATGLAVDGAYALLTLAQGAVVLMAGNELGTPDALSVGASLLTIASVGPYNRRFLRSMVSIPSGELPARSSRRDVTYGARGLSRYAWQPERQVLR